ncbi:thiamine pyrophosphate-dependent enzyme [Rhodoplanes sp. Z2-YC6860]|uniref:thiamine pyrophosphate-dependent enzyme n=1 Tax=Rhodoplanes sp. Z2-YC6860 TaxID=674703 RepID=UPI00078E9865|nr:thiamine pyrophosphate-dependent enzyme [Rhodoplanes sp. Z2-YC6860]AMN42875.1 TPP-binding protein [Rhodoplanes sp. Z2-YC6860]
MASSRKKASTNAVTMTAAEAVVDAMIAHGLDTIYALPGVQNDLLFEALFKAGEKMRVVHTRHEQGAGYMALGAALATGKPSAYAVVPGPGLLNSSAALLTAYSMNAQVLALIGEIPDADIGKHLGHLHEIRDQAGILERLVDYSALIRKPEQAPKLVAEAMRSMAQGRPGPASLQCAIDVWGKAGNVVPQPPLKIREPKIDETAIRKAAKLLGAAKNPMIICGGGAQGASEEISALAAMLQAPVLGYRRGRGVLDSRNPFSVTLPLGYELWPEVDVVLGVGTRMLMQFRQWGTDKNLKVIRVDADADEPGRLHKPAAALIGDAKPVLKRLLEVLPAHNARRLSRKSEMETRQTASRKRLEETIGPQVAFLDAIRAELPEDGIFVDEVTQLGFASRLAFPVYRPRTYLSPGYQDNLGWGFATALGAQDARRDVPVVSISGDGGFMFTANEMATAVRHRIPLTAIVFNDGAFGNVRRIQQERFGNRLIASDLANPDFVKFAESFGASADRARSPQELRAALRRALPRRDGPTLIDVPVGAFPSPWPFIFPPANRGP